MASVDVQSRTPGALAVWIGVWTGPVAWTIHLVVCYLLVPFACATGYTWVFHVTTATTGGATLLAGILAFRAWRRSRVGLETDASDWTGIDRLVRRRGFMGLIGVFLSAIFFVLIIMEAGGTFVLSPCQYRQYGGQALHNPAAQVALPGRAGAPVGLNSCRASSTPPRGGGQAPALPEFGEGQLHGT